MQSAGMEYVQPRQEVTIGRPADATGGVAEWRPPS
jgi:hypothetical protein